MKITILSTAYPLRGGIAHFTGLLYKELSKNNNVNVVTFSRQYPAILFPGKTQLEDGDKVDKIPTVVKVDSVHPFNWIKVGNEIRKDAPDLLIFNYWMPYFAPTFGTISRCVKKNKKTKIVVISHNVIPHEKKPGDKALTKYFFNSVDYFITMSKSVQNDLFSLYPNAFQKLLFHPVYSNFVETVDKETARNFLKIKSENVILFFGFIRDYKGLDVLLNSAALIKDKFDFDLVIAGEFYSNEEKYLALIKDLQLEEKVKLFNDFIPTNEVKYFFSACDVVVLPYKSATQSGIVQIANNFNKPVISTNVGGLGEVVENGKTGYLIEKENPKQLAETILKYYNENKETVFVNNIINKSVKFSWHEFANGMMELIEQQ